MKFGRRPQARNCCTVMLSKSTMTHTRVPVTKSVCICSCVVDGASLAISRQFARSVGYISHGHEIIERNLGDLERNSHLGQVRAPCLRRWQLARCSPAARSLIDSSLVVNDCATHDSGSTTRNARLSAYHYWIMSAAAGRPCAHRDCLMDGLPPPSSNQPPATSMRGPAAAVCRTVI